MYRMLVTIFLFLSFCNVQAMADNVPTKTVVQGNHGYVYGTPPKVGDSAAASGTNALNPIRGIANGIWKLDNWVKEHLW